MDAWNCERNWAKRIPTGIDGSLCFGLEQSQYVSFWCAVAAVTLVTYLIIRAKEALAEQRKKQPGSLQQLVRQKLRSLFSGAAKGSDLENGLLSHDALAKQSEAIRLQGERMSLTCKELGVESGLEAASLATLLVVQHRRRYGSVSIGVRLAASKSMREFDVEPETPQMSFASLLRTVDKSLTALKSSTPQGGAGSETPEVGFAWDREDDVQQDGCWNVKPAGDGYLAVKGSSAEEERSFQLCFDHCAQNPHGCIWQVPLVPASSLELVNKWGAPATVFGDYRNASSRLIPVPQLLNQQKGDPKSVAIEGKGFKITFEDLHARAAAIAKAVVKEADPAKQKAVVVCMGRGECIGPAFIGILQAGYHVIPVDVHWPSDRIWQVATDSEAGLALVEQASLECWLSLGPNAPKALIVDDAFYAQHATDAQEPNLQQSISALDQEHPAVMLFTSGSTGKPKGIILSHGYLTALILGVAQSKRMTSLTKTLCYHSPTWMPFLDYLFAPIVVGGCCLYFPEDSSHVVKPSDLKAFAESHGATSAGFVPAMLDILVDEGLPPTLSDIGVGGAAVPAELCTRVVAALPPCQDGSSGILYTGYSGTEQGDVTQMQMRRPEDVDAGVAGSGFMGAGGPHTAQRCAILDAAFQVVGPEGIGEIAVTGPGLASGYLKLPEKTEETFLPFCKALDGERTARSGDLGKWTAAGNLKLVGRRDSMVKVRGARIELGEVEGAVASHPAVKAAIVTVFEDQLLAYVVPAVPADLRDYCKERLVAYMVPHLFEGLEELPKLPNGKINKKALPKPQARTDGAETVMELDSLGQMRKFTRKAASEDRVLDNVRAILIGVVIQSHAIPLLANNLQMLDVASRPLPGTWGPTQYFIMSITRGGGWSSLAFLNGFDDTRAMRPYGLTYREPLFIALWLLLDFNWSMWYLPVFVYMRAAFCAAHWAGLEKTHLVLASQIWLLLPAFVDFYVGWQPNGLTECPSQCFCPWQEWPWAQTFSYYVAGWWVAGNNPVGHSYLGHALIFIPCYWIGFYTGGPIFKVLTKVADEPSVLRRCLIAGSVLALYCLMYTAGQPLLDGFNDQCSSFWGPSNAFVWEQVLRNLVYFVMNLSMSLTYVVFIAAAVPIHLKYLAKICFSSLIVSALGVVPCLLDMPRMALELRKWVAPAISPAVEMAWVFTVPFLFELVVGAISTTLLPIIIKAGIALYGKMAPASS